jgi:hypothetical protein
MKKIIKIKNKNMENAEDILLNYQYEKMGKDTNEKIYNDLKLDYYIDLDKNLDINDWFEILGITKKITLNKI